MRRERRKSKRASGTFDRSNIPDDRKTPYGRPFYVHFTSVDMKRIPISDFRHSPFGRPFYIHFHVGSSEVASNVRPMDVHLTTGGHSTDVHRMSVRVPSGIVPSPENYRSARVDEKIRPTHPPTGSPAFVRDPPCYRPG